MEKDIQMPHYRTPMIEKTDELRNAGYDAEFQIAETGLKHLHGDKIYQPEDIHIVEFFRFEGITNPDDMAILYVIETNDGLKGTILDAFGLYSDDDLGAFMKQVEKKSVTNGA
jgi:hypothetical protein